MEVNPLDFWKWAYSDFLSNAQRGVLAEYIVAQAVGHTLPRIEWNAYDVKAPTGLKIEVKSAAYLQSWPQQRFSLIRFGIGLKKAWDAETNTSCQTALRSADLYVFCVFTETDRALARPLSLEQWFFLVCPTALLNQRFPEQKSVSLTALEGLGLQRMTYLELASNLQQQRQV